MVFSSNIFLFLFLPLTLALYFLAPEKLVGKKYKNYLLLFFSLLFYSWGEPSYLWLLIVSIVANYFFGIAIAKDRVKNLILFFALTFNLALLLYFKYAGFVLENIASAFPSFTVQKYFLPHHLPIGISFFTFHAISYLVDIYRKKCHAQKNIFDLALYIAFFPQLIAGPIIRYNTIEKYLTKRYSTLPSFSYGVRRFLTGFAKKVIIANTLGEIADAIFSSQIDSLSTSLAWIGIICYTMQIYFDFSGYSDMAIGLARIFGFKFLENFNYPYVARSIKEFWRRWHISLSSWFRDYVYIPLGGNRVSLARQYFNLILVFFLCGLWHGASWNFVIWGLFHGFFLVFERVRIGQLFLVKLPIFFQHFYAMMIVMIGWVFFRSVDLTYAISYLNLMFVPHQIDIISNEIALLINSHFTWMVFGFSLIGFTPIVRNAAFMLVEKNKKFQIFFDLILLAAFIFSIIQLSAKTHNPFIYFQF